MPAEARNAPPHTDYAPVEIVPGRMDAGVLFVCDHATNTQPPGYDLGLPESEMLRHIAWDIGAADVTRALARRFGAPAVLSNFTRLLIDPNRGGDDPTLVMRLSDGAIIPGNREADEQEIEKRKLAFWRPYRSAIGSVLDNMTDAGKQSGTVPAIVSIHSFTHVWRGHLRPWQIGLLWDSDPRLSARLLAELQCDQRLMIGDNEPYDGALVGDTMYEFGTSRGLAHTLMELRQDLIDTPAKAAAWAGKLADPLARALEHTDIHRIEHYASRAGQGPRGRLPGKAQSSAEPQE
ncbi:MAG: N-formylglutamate amidohydrolase [Beijerinckiaceae bacterium]